MIDKHMNEKYFVVIIIMTIESNSDMSILWFAIIEKIIMLTFTNTNDELPHILSLIVWIITYDMYVVRNKCHCNVNEK